MLYLYPKKLDIDPVGVDINVFIHEETAKRLGINKGDVVVLHFPDGEMGAVVEYTTSLVGPREIGVPAFVWKRFKFSETTPVMVELLQQASSMKYISKKLRGERLNYDEIYAIIKDIADYKLTPVELTYFAASSYCPGFDMQELLYITKAMVETGDKLSFDDLGDIVADKHSIGGIPNKAITPVLVPILINMGMIVPNTFSRAITTPAGTADVLEVLMPVTLTPNQIKATVETVGGCLAWGGALNIAPVDDIIIQVEKVLDIESYDKFVASIMAKKIAMGIKYLLIDVPYGPHAKVPKKDVKKVTDMFKAVADYFGIKLVVFARKTFGLDGKGVGPALEARDVLRILERHIERPIHTENVVLEMAAKLGVLSGLYNDEFEALEKARSILDTGQALETFWEIAKAQGADSVKRSTDIVLGSQKASVVWAGKKGEVVGFNPKKIVEVTRLLGAPADAGAGIYFEVFVGDEVGKADLVAHLYSSTSHRLELGLKRFEELKHQIILVE